MSYRYRSVYPSAALRPYIAGMWHLSRQATDPALSTVRVLPEGAIELVLNVAGAANRTQPDPACFVVGQLPRAIAMHSSAQQTECLGLRLRPAGAAAFLGIPAVELTGQIVDLDRLTSRLNQQLTEWIEHATPDRAGLARLEQLLLKHVQRTQPTVDQRIEYAIHRLTHADQLVSVAALADECALSARQLERRFTQVVGLSPKLFARIQRFRRVCRVVERARPQNWAGIAADHGYVDQSHLIRDFQAFAGASPTQIYSDAFYSLVAHDHHRIQPDPGV